MIYVCLPSGLVPLTLEQILIAVILAVAGFAIGLAIAVLW